MEVGHAGQQTSPRSIASRIKQHWCLCSLQTRGVIVAGLPGPALWFRAWRCLYYWRLDSGLFFDLLWRTSRLFWDAPQYPGISEASGSQPLHEFLLELGILWNRSDQHSVVAGAIHHG